MAVITDPTVGQGLHSNSNYPEGWWTGGGGGHRTLHNMEGQGKGKAISELLKQLYNMQMKAMAMRGGLKPTTASPICKSPP